MTLRSSAVSTALAAIPILLTAQDRLKTMPGHDAAERIARDAPAAVSGAVTSVTWIDADAFEYQRDGKRFRFSVSRRAAAELSSTPAVSAGRGRGRGSAAAVPDRGRQFESDVSPDGALKVFYRDRNVWL